MKARKVAAQFAAYTWYQENRGGKERQEEATRFARKNWTAFLPIADEGWGRLLLHIASERAKRNGRQVRKRYRSLAG
ncbi:MAG TPA: hypothetical protein VH682_12780 [Gemmataceae bacterium]